MHVRVILNIYAFCLFLFTREFNGADMDQGLLLHYFVINTGNALLIDTDTRSSRFFAKGLLHGKDTVGNAEESLTCCNGVLPTHAFAHFTGRSKPWMVKQEDFDSARRGGSMDKWKVHLDSLNLPVNSSNILGLGLGSPLGFFNAKFPKGGFKKIDEEGGEGGGGGEEGDKEDVEDVDVGEENIEERRFRL